MKFEDRQIAGLLAKTIAFYYPTLPHQSSGSSFLLQSFISPFI